MRHSVIQRSGWLKASFWKLAKSMFFNLTTNLTLFFPKSIEWAFAGFCNLFILSRFYSWDYFRFSHTSNFTLVELTSQTPSRSCNLSEVEKEKQTKVAYHEAEMIRQQVAVFMPDKFDLDPMTFKFEVLPVCLCRSRFHDDSKKVFTEAKNSFCLKKFHEVIPVFRDFIEEGIFWSTTFDEAIFIAESYFQVFDGRLCWYRLKPWFGFFPESEMTGFAPLRLSEFHFERQLDDDGVGNHWDRQTRLFGSSWACGSLNGLCERSMRWLQVIFLASFHRSSNSCGSK